MIWIWTDYFIEESKTPIKANTYGDNFTLGMVVNRGMLGGWTIGAKLVSNFNPIELWFDIGFLYPLSTIQRGIWDNEFALPKKAAKFLASLISPHLLEAMRLNEQDEYPASFFDTENMTYNLFAIIRLPGGDCIFTTRTTWNNYQDQIQQVLRKLPPLDEQGGENG